MAASKYENLCKLYQQASVMERDIGVAYYQTQQDRLAVVARKFAVDLNVVIGVFCALSPNNSEQCTFRGTIKLLDTPDPHTTTSAYPRNNQKALRIIGGEPALDVLRGRKVRSFFTNHLTPQDCAHVTVDGHMFNAWRGERVRLNSTKLRVTDALYDLVEQDVVWLAGRLGVVPCQMQSVLWLVWKRVENVLHRPQLKLFNEEDWI